MKSVYVLYDRQNDEVVGVFTSSKTLNIWMKAAIKELSVNMSISILDARENLENTFGEIEKVKVDPKF